MKKLNILLQGQFLKSYNLEEGMSYVVGREASCDIILDQDKSISRQHLRMSLNGNILHLEVISKYGEFSFKGDLYSTCEISVNDSIQIGTYSLQFSEDNNSKKEIEAFTVNSIDEKTVVSHQTLVGYVKVLKSNTMVGEVKLSGARWVAGRDSGCDIVILDPRVSRKQFEIEYIAGDYYVRDLGSVNGTELNGQILPENSKVKLNSGDELRILDNRIFYELRDPTFEQKIVYFEQNKLVPQTENLIPEASASPFATQWLAVLERLPTPLKEKLRHFDWKKNRIRLTIAFVLVFSIILGLQDDKPDSSQNPNQNAKRITPIDKLKPEQQSMVRQTYSLAKNLFTQGKYELAKQEIMKIQQYVPEYEDSKQLEQFIDEAVRLKADQMEMERIAKQKQEIEDKIQSQYQECKKLLNFSITQEKMDACLSPVIQFNPEHSLITELQNAATVLIEEKNAKALQAKEYELQVRRLQSMYGNAESVLKSGELLQAIEAYQKVAKSSLPDPKELKPASQRKIASIQKNISIQVDEMYKKSDDLLKSKDYKNAIIELRKAEKVDPTNEDIKSRITSAKNILKKNLMEKYQEAILEESVGNVPSAIPKWKEIISLDVQDGDYYQKAKIKLKKYGAF